MPAYETLLQSQVPRISVFHGLQGRPLHWDYIYTGKHNISIYSGKLDVSTQKHTKGFLPPLLPFTPIPASVDGKSPHITSHLVGGGIKCPFQALSPCLIQTLAGALQCSAEAVFLRHCRRNFEHDAAKTVPVGHLAHINF